MPQGKKIINKHAEAIIEKAIKDLYLTNQRISVQKVVLEVKRLCHEYHILEVPHANTVRNRIAAISQRDSLRKRGHKEKADNKFTPADSKHLLDYVRDRGAVTFETLLARHFLGKWDRANGISQIWYLVAHGYLVCDLSMPLQPSTELWVSGSLS